MKGSHVPDAFATWSAETMVAFRARPQLKPGSAWVPLALDPDRMTWRDRHALFHSVAHEPERPRMLDWLDVLLAAGELSEQGVVPLDVCGLLPDQAKVQDWRRASLPLPLAYLPTPELVDANRGALALAEHAGQLLQARLLSTPTPSGTLTGPNPRWSLSQDLQIGMAALRLSRTEVETLARHLTTPADYWACLDGTFRRFVTSLPDNVTTGPDAARAYDATLLPRWAREVERTARQAFAVAIGGLDRTARTLCAVALAEARFRWCLGQFMASFRAPIGSE